MIGRIGAWETEIREMEATMRQMRRRIASLRKSIASAQVTPSSGCVFCDLKLEPTNCTDGWFHLSPEFGTARCLHPKRTRSSAG